ncbi:MAG TPA: hypothetical protein VGE90_09005 [Chitinophaga sp.]
MAACKLPAGQPNIALSSVDNSTIAAKPDSIPQAPLHLEEATIYIDSAMTARLSWIGPLASKALQSSANPRIRRELKDSSITWIWDKLILSDTATYISLHVGHEEEDKKGFKRFVTAGWLYVDTLSRNVYEYSVAGDSLIKLLSK